MTASDQHVKIQQDLAARGVKYCVGAYVDIHGVPKAKVVPIVAKLTRGGYEIEVLETWRNFPTDDVEADTALMNTRLQGYIDPMPAQYYWVHRRFKTRPEGDPPIY